MGYVTFGNLYETPFFFKLILLVKQSFKIKVLPSLVK